MIPIAALKALVTALSGGVQTIWFTEPKPDVGRQAGGIRAYIELTLGSVTDPIDDYRQQYDAENDKLDSLVCSYRVFTISMRFNSIDARHQAHDLCERVRARLQTFTARQTYNDNNMALVRIAGSANFKGKVDNVTALISTLDVKFAIAFNVDPGDDDGAYIKTVNGNDVVPFTPES